MTIVSQKPDEQVIELAKEFLRYSEANLDRAKFLRVRHAQLAKHYGMTNQEIGDLLNVSESRVRQMLLRAA